MIYVHFYAYMSVFSIKQSHALLQSGPYIPSGQARSEQSDPFQPGVQVHDPFVGSQVAPLKHVQLSEQLAP